MLTKKYNKLTALSIGAFFLTLNTSSVFADPVLYVDDELVTHENSFYEPEEDGVITLMPSSDIHKLELSMEREDELVTVTGEDGHDLGVQLLAGDSEEKGVYDLDLTSDVNINLTKNDTLGTAGGVGIEATLDNNLLSGSTVQITNQGKITAEGLQDYSYHGYAGMLIYEEDPLAKNISATIDNSGIIDFSKPSNAAMQIGMFVERQTKGHSSDQLSAINDNKIILTDYRGIGIGSIFEEPVYDENGNLIDDIEHHDNKFQVSLINNGTIEFVDGEKPFNESDRSTGIKSLTRNTTIENNGSIIGAANTSVIGIKNNVYRSSVLNRGTIDLAGNISFGIYNKSTGSEVVNTGTISVSQMEESGEYSPSTAMRYSIDFSNEVLPTYENLYGGSKFMINEGSITLGGAAIGMDIRHKPVELSNGDYGEILGINLGSITAFDQSGELKALSMRMTGAGAIGINTGSLENKIQLREGGSLILAGNPDEIEQSISRIQVKSAEYVDYDQAYNSWIHVGLDSDAEEFFHEKGYDDLYSSLRNSAKFTINQVDLTSNANTIEMRTVEEYDNGKAAYFKVFGDSEVTVDTFNLMNAGIITQDSSQTSINQLNLAGQNDLILLNESRLNLGTTTTIPLPAFPIATNTSIEITNNASLATSYASVTEGIFADTSQFSFSGDGYIVLDGAGTKYDQEILNTFEAAFKSQYSNFTGNFAYTGFDLEDVSVITPEIAKELESPEDDLELYTPEGEKETELGRTAKSYSVAESVETVEVSEVTTLVGGTEETELVQGEKLENIVVAEGATLQLGLSNVEGEEDKVETKGVISTAVELAADTALKVKNGIFTIKNLVADTASIINVGDSQNQGSLTLEKASLNGATLFADPAWKDGERLAEDASHVSIATFNGTKIIDGHLVAGQNSIIALGTTSSVDIDDSVNTLKVNGSSWGNGITAALYLDSPYTVGATGSLMVDGYLTTAPTGLVANQATFAKDSLLVVDVDGLTGNAALTTGTISIDSDSYLGIKGSLVDGQSYTILSTNTNFWDINNIYIYDQLMDVASISNNGITIKNKGTAKTIYGAKGDTAEFLTNYGAYAGNGTVATDYMDTITASGVNQSKAGRNTEIASNIAGIGGVAHLNIIAADLIFDVTDQRTDITSNYSSGLYFQPLYQKTDINGMKVGNYGNDMDMDIYGAALGFDSVAGNFLYGGAFVYGSGDVDGSGFTSAARTDGDFYGATLYGSYSFDNGAQLTLDALYTTMSSDVSYGSLSTKSLDSSVFGVGLEASYLVDLDGATLTPYAGIRYQHYSQDGYNAGDVFKTNSASMDTVIIPVGVKYKRTFDHQENEAKISLNADLGVDFALGDTDFINKSTLVGTPEKLNLTTAVYDDVTGKAAIDLTIEKDNVFGSIGVKASVSKNVTNFGAGIKVGFRF